jgi:hypothetical protein
LLSQRLLAASRRSELVKDELLSAESKAQFAAERNVIGREAADVRVAIEASQNAIRRLTELYGDGVINSPVSGIVGSLEISEFEADQRDLPPLFAKTQLSAAGWPSDWLRRLVLPHLPFPAMAPQAGVERS